MGKFFEESFRTNVNESGKITSFNTATRNKRSTMNFYGGPVEGNGIVKFDSRCATFTFYTFILITSLYIVYNAMAMDEENYVVSENIRVTRLLLFADWPEKKFLANQKRAIQTLLELVR